MIRLLSLLFVSSLVLLVSSRDIAREKRHVTLFNIVKFDNDPCNSQQTVTTGGRRKGTCFTEDECSNKNGVASGSCASGFGVCCLFLATSGTASQNCTYYRSEGFPSALTATGASTSSLALRKCANDVCRVRLDFETFEIGGPNVATPAIGDAECTDVFQVTTATNNFIPTICGSNTGEHIYVEFPGNNNGEINLSFTFDATARTRRFEIKATQYACNDKNQPPVGCLQWHTGGTGRIKTFNFDADTAHLNEQDYNICVRQEKDMCCIEYSVCSDIPEDESFSLLGMPATAMQSGVNGVDAATNLGCLTDPTTRNDYIAIPGATQQCGCKNLFPPVNRFCGNRLNTVGGYGEHIPVCDCCPPFDIQVYTDGTAIADAAAPNPGTNDGVTDQQSRGVCLDYKQIPC